MILLFVDDRLTKIALLIFEIHTPIWFVLDLLIGFQRSDYGSFLFLETFVSFLSMFVIFCFIYIENNRKLRRKEMELTQSRLNSLQLQMDPHFMSNALNAISVLTDTDPKAAKRMISDLSGYLRENFYDPDGKESLMIPFPAELERLERYLAIERIRFPDIRVDYWLETTEFEIPAMTLQPLVENAIKHGICKKKHCEGSIEIRSFENEEAYSVLVEDDGAGFDERELSARREGEEKRKRIGIPNTEKRLELMCGGTLSICSTPGSGTVCEITIPKRRK
jgi:sensor histidine kinase YesM